VNLLKEGAFNWWKQDKGIQLSFLPSYVPAVPTKLDTKTNFTYTVYGDFGQVFASEPSNYAVTQVIKWDARYIKFHYPSEHTVNGTHFDLEMQIYHQEEFWTHAICVSGIGIISVFFNVSTPPNPFFQFLDGTSPLDLSSILTPDFSLNNYIMGYVGTNSVPNCERGVCWYIVKDVFSIGSDQLEKLKIPGVPFNNRQTSEPVKNYKQYDAPGMLYTPP
jgi:carbonic anhydrase